MTTINCSLNCVYQQDGKCAMDSITTNSISTNSDCVYFQEKAAKASVSNSKS